MGPEEPRVHDHACGRRPPPRPGGDEQEEHDDERVGGRERAQEGRDEAADRALLVRVQDPVLGQVREAAVGEPELLVEPVGYAGVAPPLERHEVDVDEAEHRERGADTDECHDDATPPRAIERDEAPEDVGAERQKVVTERVQLPSSGRLAVEPRLRHEPVRDDDRAVGEGEAVGPAEVGDRPGGGEREDDRSEQENVFPGGHDIEGRVAHAGLPQQRHREVVEREPHDQDEQRDARESGRHVIATSIMPRLRISTAPGKSARKSEGPSRWFSFAQDLPARSYARPASDAGSQCTSGSLVCTSTGNQRLGVVRKTRRPTRSASSTNAACRSRPPTCSITAFEWTTSKLSSGKGSAQASPWTYGICG